MEYYVKQLTCSKCGAALTASGELHAGMLLVCEHCDTPYVVCERDFRTPRPVDADDHGPTGGRHVHSHYHYHAPSQAAQDGGNEAASGATAHRRWEEQDNEAKRAERMRAKRVRHRLCDKLSKADCAVIAVTLAAAMAQTSADAAVAVVALLCGEAIGLVAILCGAFELKDRFLELAQDEARAPMSSERAQGMSREDVIAAFREAGFEDVRPEGLRDLGFLRRHLSSSEGQVTTVRIGRRSDFNADAIFRKSDVVSVRYHSAKESLVVRLLSL
jgi:hypothetical protein